MRARAIPGIQRRNKGRPAAWLLAAGIMLASLALMPPAAIAADDSTTLAIGVLGHDQGPASDHHEHGIDLNLEAQFAPLDFWGTPRPHLGATLNFIGDTSVVYAGLSFPVIRHKNWLVDGFISAAAHDGPLHKDRAGCRQDSDCGYGVRVMPRLGVELGYRLSDKSAISVFYDHMSHYWIIDAENEGLEHAGLRYLFSF